MTVLWVFLYVITGVWVSAVMWVALQRQCDGLAVQGRWGEAERLARWGPGVSAFAVVLWPAYLFAGFAVAVAYKGGSDAQV